MACFEVDGGEFTSQLESARADLREKFSRAHRLLQQGEDAIMKQLYQLEESYNEQRLRQTEEIQELLASKENLQSTIKGNKNQKTLQAMLAPLEAKIKELQESGKGLQQRITLDWYREEELEELLRGICSIKLSKLNKENYIIRKPVIVACKYRGNASEPGAFKYPTAVSVYHKNGFIYVCDESNNRIQVFNKSCEFIFSICENMKYPAGICFNNDQVFVTQFLGFCVNIYSTNGEYVTSVGSRGDKKLEFNSPLGIEFSEYTNSIYICDRNNNRIQILNLDLTFNSFITGLIDPTDIKVNEEEIFILDRKNPCLHVYNYEHQLIREFISFGYFSYEVFKSNHFCMDRRGNILMTDRSACRVLIFSTKDGKLIQKFGKKGDNPGEFKSPRGIAIDSDNKVIVISSNPDHCIQIF